MREAKHIDRLEVLSQATYGSLWSLTTRSSLSTVMKEGWLTSKFPDYALRKGDKIFTVCDFEGDEPSFATLAVTKVEGRKGDATVVRLP